MERICHVHIGLHKTGTTTIQKMLGAEIDRLAGHGFCRPSTGLDKAGLAHHPLAEEVNSQLLSHSPQFGALACELEAKAWPERVILTSEAFSSEIHDPRIIARFRKHVDRLGYRLRVIVFVRPQEEAVHSIYTQKLKMWGVRGDFDRFWRRAIDSIDWDYERRFAALFESGIDLQIFPFSRHTIERGVCRTFLLAIGVPEFALAGFSEPPPVNVTPGPKAMAATLEINRQLEKRGVRGNRQTLDTVANFMRKMATFIGPEKISFNALSPEIAAVIRERFRDSNERFARRAFGRAWEDVFAGEINRARPVNVFDPAAAPMNERQEFEAFVADMTDAICELAVPRPETED